MLQKIDDFKKGHSYLIYLINDLEALLGVLKFEDKTWKELFRGYWWDLEQVYAVAIDEGKKSLDLEEQLIINEAIKNLDKMINEKLREYLNSLKNE